MIFSSTKVLHPSHPIDFLPPLLRTKTLSMFLALRVTSVVLGGGRERAGMTRFERVWSISEATVTHSREGCHLQAFNRFAHRFVSPIAVEHSPSNRMFVVTCLPIDRLPHSPIEIPEKGLDDAPTHPTKKAFSTNDRRGATGSLLNVPSLRLTIRHSLYEPSLSDHGEEQILSAVPVD
jgi:hypothetical protein